ncbi:MAG: flippase-like domain-containing protein [Microthrixaceae bacterium]
MTATATSERAGDDGELFDSGAEVVDYERSPLDVLRFLAFAAASVVAAVLTRWLPDGMDGFEENLTSLLEVPWSWVRVVADLVLVATVLVAGLAVLVVPLVTRRFRLFGYVLAANVVSGIAVGALVGWLGLGGDVSSSGSSADGLARTVSADVVGGAQLVAAFVTIAPFVSRTWRRAGTWTIVAVIVLRLVVASGESTHVALTLLSGAAVGSAVLLAFGRPSTRPRLASILDSLRSSGLVVSELHPASVDARGSVPYYATLEDGGGIFTKVLGSEQRAADLLFRFYRSVRLRNVGDERPFSSLRRTVEHEALVALQARDVGVRTPRLRCVAPVGADSFLLAYDRIGGDSLDRVEPERLTDRVLVALWEQVALLRTFRIAHRDLRLANVFLADDGEPWLIDFGFSEIAASDTLLRADVAQLLASLVVSVGPRRAVGPAIEVLGADAVTQSLGRLQPAALSGATQSELKAHKGLLEQLRTEIEQQCDVEEPPLEPVTRVGARQLFTLALLVAVFYVLIPQFADLPGVVAEVQDASWIWLVPILIASAATHLAATMSTIGSVPAQLPVGPTAAAQVAASFASKLAPAGLGGMALNVRYLQRRGIETPVATSSIGLNAAAGVVAHVVLAAVFLLWVGREAFGNLELPSPRALLIGVIVVAILGAISMLVPSSRRLVVEKLLPILGTAVSGLRDVLTTPTKLVLLLGGSVLITLCYVLAFEFSTRAFDIDLRFAAIGAVYLVGSAVATVAPTPGGLGATEAALIGGLVAVGVPDDQAVPAVFLFRLATFWLPILPGWIAFTWLRRTDRL